MRALIFALALLVAAALVVTGFALWWPPAAFMASGVCVGLGAWLTLTEGSAKAEAK